MGKIIYIACVLLYIVLYLIKSGGHYFPVISDYVADLLCLPIVLGLCRFLMIRLSVVSSDFELSGAMIIFAVAAFSIIFEGILPYYASQYHSDWIDMVCYTAGAFSYYSFRKLKNTKRYEIPSEI